MFNHEFGLEIKSTSTSSNYYSKMMALLQLATDPFTNEIDGDLHPCSLSSKASQEGNPTYEEAMNGPHRDGFHNAMIKELKTLTDMESWEVVKKSTWEQRTTKYLGVQVKEVSRWESFQIQVSILCRRAPSN
jgi:hypothetical protein